MNTLQLAVSVKRLSDYDPAAFCAFIEHWAASNNGSVKVSILKKQILDQFQNGSELLFLNVEYSNYPTTGNYVIEIRQFVSGAAGLFEGIECVGISAA